MKNRLRRTVAVVVGLTLLLLSPHVAAGASLGRLEGRIFGPDGRPAAGYEVLLVDSAGEVVARGAAAQNGRYSIGDVPPGEYAMGIEHDGAVAPVVAPPATLEGGRTVRRDVKLVSAEGAPVLAPGAAGSPGVTWWSRLTRAQKILTIVGIVVGTGVIIAAVDDDDDERASPSE